MDTQTIFSIKLFILPVMNNKQTNLNQMQPTNIKEKKTFAIVIPYVGNNFTYLQKIF